MVVGLIEKAKSQMPDVRIEEIDVAENPAVAMKYRVMATPALAINGRLAFTGVPSARSLRARLEAAAREAPGA